MKIFSFDAETDGLYGDIFAIGAVVLDESGIIIDTFAGKACEESVSNAWVKENVLPYTVDLKQYASRQELREQFWSFYMRYREESICVADIMHPVESLLMRLCVQDNPEDREFKGPYPLYDLSTLLLACVVDPLAERRELIEYKEGNGHNPLDDATVSGLCFLKYLSQCQNLITNCR